MLGLVWLQDEQETLLVCRDERAESSDFLQCKVFVKIGELERTDQLRQTLGRESTMSPVQARAERPDSLQWPLLDKRDLFQVSQERLRRLCDDVQDSQTCLSSAGLRYVYGWANLEVLDETT